MLSSHLNSLFTCVFIFGALSGRFSVRGVWHVYTWSWCVVWGGVARGAAEACRRPRGFLPSWLLLVLGGLPSRLAPIWTMALWVLLLVAWFARRSRTRCIAFFFSRASFVSFSDPGTCACTRTLLHSCSLVRARSPPCLWVCLGMHTRMGVLVGACFSLLFPRSFPLFFTEGGRGGGESAIPSGGFGGAAPGAVVCLCVMCACLVGWA